jgi:hypothetical protein
VVDEPRYYINDTGTGNVELVTRVIQMVTDGCATG